MKGGWIGLGLSLVRFQLLVLFCIFGILGKKTIVYSSFFLSKRQLYLAKPSARRKIRLWMLCGEGGADLKKVYCTVRVSLAYGILRYLCRSSTDLREVIRSCWFGYLGSMDKLHRIKGSCFVRWELGNLDLQIRHTSLLWVIFFENNHYVASQFIDQFCLFRLREQSLHFEIMMSKFVVSAIIS